uniref:Immunoglobulin V-set domain-containing protein n=1 Tax=Astyanax mexicanus TaxID=7994 RepID=A0A3B1ICG8_ASTMX
NNYFSIFCVLSRFTFSRVSDLHDGENRHLGCSRGIGTVVSSTQSSNQSLYIEWRTFSGTVFERRGKEHYEGDGYEGRVDIPEDKLKKGNCSLVLKEVKAEDAGVYESYLMVKREKRSLQSKRVFIQSVELSVEDTSEAINSAQDKPNPQARSSGLNEALDSSGVIHFPSPIITFTILTIILLFMQCFIDPL